MSVIIFIASSYQNICFLGPYCELEGRNHNLFIFVSLAFSTVPGTERVFKMSLITLSPSLMAPLSPPGPYLPEFPQDMFLSTWIPCVLTVQSLLMILQFTHQSHIPTSTPIASFLLLQESLSLEMLPPPQITSVPKLNILAIYLSSQTASFLANIIIEWHRQNCFHYGTLSCVGFYIVGVQNARDQIFMFLNIKFEHKYTQ